MIKKCNDCNVEMVDCQNLHTDYVGGVDFEERIYVNYFNNPLRVRARVCPNCMKVELYIDPSNPS